PIAGMDSCEVPEPTVLGDAMITNPVAMEKVESGLVQIVGYHVAKHFGPKVAKNNVFANPANPDAVSDQSNCDFNGDGQVDFASQDEGSCSNACAADPECSEWTSFSARGNYKATKATMSGSSVIQIQTGTVSGFDPLANRGLVMDAVTGTLRNFSG